MLSKILVLLILSNSLFADNWRWRNHRYYGHRSYGDGRVSPGAATAIGIGAGVLGYVIGRKSQEKTYTEATRECSYEEKIECRIHDIKVIIDGERKTAKITKCRVNGGEWKIPD